MEASEVCSVVFTVFSCWESPTSRVVFSPFWTLSNPWRVMVWQKTTLLVSPHEGRGHNSWSSPCRPSRINLSTWKEIFPQLEKNKQWHSFQLILLYVHICFHCLLSLFPTSNQFLMELLYYSMETAYAGRCCSLCRWLPDGAGLGCSWLLVLMWSDRASEAKETTEDRSIFQSFPRSYQVNRRLKTNQIFFKKKILC